MKDKSLDIENQSLNQSEVDISDKSDQLVVEQVKNDQLTIKQANADEPVSDQPLEKELNGPKGLEPTRYGDWESKGRCYDF